MFVNFMIGFKCLCPICKDTFILCVKKFISTHCKGRPGKPNRPLSIISLPPPRHYHLFSTFSAKPGKSFTSIACPSSSRARPVNFPKTWCWSDFISFISVQEALSSTGTKSISNRPSSEEKVQGAIKSFSPPGMLNCTWLSL